MPLKYDFFSKIVKQPINLFLKKIMIKNISDASRKIPATDRKCKICRNLNDNYKSNKNHTNLRHKSTIRHQRRMPNEKQSTHPPQMLLLKPSHTIDQFGQHEGIQNLIALFGQLGVFSQGRFQNDEGFDVGGGAGRERGGIGECLLGWEGG